MNFETVIGLEVHVELNTNSKIFSPTSAHFGNDQNANTNVIDWSFPGVLPAVSYTHLWWNLAKTSESNYYFKSRNY